MRILQIIVFIPLYFLYQPINCSEADYEALQVFRDVSDEALKDKYRSLARETHPDIYQGKVSTEKLKEFEEKFKEIDGAYKRILKVRLEERHGKELEDIITEFVKKFSPPEDVLWLGALKPEIDKGDIGLRLWKDYIDETNVESAITTFKRFSLRSNIIQDLKNKNETVSLDDEEFHEEFKDVLFLATMRITEYISVPKVTQNEFPFSQDKFNNSLIFNSPQDPRTLILYDIFYKRALPYMKEAITGFSPWFLEDNAVLKSIFEAIQHRFNGELALVDLYDYREKNPAPNPLFGFNLYYLDNLDKMNEKTDIFLATNKDNISHLSMVLNKTQMVLLYFQYQHLVYGFSLDPKGYAYELKAAEDDKVDLYKYEITKQDYDESDKENESSSGILGAPKKQRTISKNSMPHFFYIHKFNSMIDSYEKFMRTQFGEELLREKITQRLRTIFTSKYFWYFILFESAIYSGNRPLFMRQFTLLKDALSNLYKLTTKRIKKD